MTNFDYLKKEKEFNSFVDIAIVAERTYKIDVNTCILNCRRAMEAAIKWMFSIDNELVVPYKDNLNALMHVDAFKDIVGDDLWKRLEFIRKYGNEVAHTAKDKANDVAKLCLNNLFCFFDWISCCYGSEYEEKEFDESLLDNKVTDNVSENVSDVNLQTLIEENKALKEELSARRIERQDSYVRRPLELSEFSTRKLYIDAMLIDAGWVENRDWINEVELQGMPNNAGVGFADYVLYDDTQKPLAIIEAKRTCKDVEIGRQQAILYANILEKQYKRRPVIFLSNGFETRIIDNTYPERKVSSIYSKRDLEKYFNLMSTRGPLNFIEINDKIAGRYYQKEAIKSVCEAFDNGNRRKALLVMATGSGKTRTVIALVDVLINNGWIKNVLFLADRKSLVTQAKRSFTNLLPNLSSTNLVEDKTNCNAHAVFSTYKTMMNCIDTVKEDDKKIFTCGHFDLIICDEAHRSIYNKYKDIFTYFDAPIVGLTATPKDEIDKNTYDIFELESGVPTYGYELNQAVKDGFLVDFVSVETELKFISNGITWDQLSDEEKEIYEDTFVDENGDYPDSIESSAINEWVFNEDTIKKVLRTLFTHGIKIDYGQKIGKTIIFAKNHQHAEKIFEIFNKEYPQLNGYAKVIDNTINYSQTLIDEFSQKDKLPQIAISVDMLDTGIDVPEVLNLVFFKPVKSKAKFWQMIGRGTRLCEGLINGENKKEFYIFDFCGNFEFFRMNKGKASANMLAVQSAIFNLKFQIVYKLQDLAYQTDELKQWRNDLVDEMVTKVKELDRDKFDVHQHIKYVDLYSNPDNYNSLTYADCLEIKEELAPLIYPDKDEINAVRFDALMYGIELAYVAQKKYIRGINDLLKKAKNVASVANIPEIQVQSELLNKIVNTDYLNKCDISDFEFIRKNLRDLIKYIPKKSIKYDTDFEDEILNVKWNDSNLNADELQNYKEKVEYYIKQHENDNPVFAKIKENKQLNMEDIGLLEDVLWNRLGSKEDYYSEVGKKPLGEFVREIVGLDMRAAKEAFSKYQDEREMNSSQIYFVNQIIEYIVMNGLMKDKSVLQESPFTDKGTVYELFGDDLQLWAGIDHTINQINDNAIRYDWEKLKDSNKN
ncbi:MAG: DEAD/DEAH box helicase family protein [Solobacterium sp.]|nr:DEAD/DEAH box helicase family protein [Solobacterium sp.]